MTMPSTSSNYGSCAACLQDILTRQYLTCCLCSKKYDIECVNVTEKRFYNTMSNEHKSQWRCDECRNNMPRTNNIDTPVKRDVDSYVNTSKRVNAGLPADLPVATSSSVAPLLSATESPTERTEAASLSVELITELRLLREEMRAHRAEMHEFRGTINSLTSAVEVCNRRIDELAVRVDAVEQNRGDNADTAAIAALERTVADLKLDLNDRDQELLCNDVEISGIPEENSERCCHIVLAVAQKLGVKLEERDLVSVERAGPARRSSTEDAAPPRPRPLVVRLARRAQRDQLLAAARVRRDATTAGLGLSSAARRFYVNERLTPTNRHLFYKARSESARTQWKYVWTREGKIYARKEHGAPRHRLRSENDIVKVFG
ncbi:hypothetical protein ABMA27_006660 [Loxostege sticticalis]|uniref:FP protein C-terminal domain-containing protein n=1 Tax=Loxostege sticticalis TaxID=481309 RepID=A0ABR3IJZ7_LOXSC